MKFLSHSVGAPNLLSYVMLLMSNVFGRDNHGQTILPLDTEFSYRIAASGVSEIVGKFNLRASASNGAAFSVSRTQK